MGGAVGGRRRADALLEVRQLFVENAVDLGRLAPRGHDARRLRLIMSFVAASKRAFILMAAGGAGRRECRAGKWSWGQLR